MDRATLIIESKTQGIASSQQQLNGLTDSSRKAKTATDQLGGASRKTGTALIDKLGGGLNKVSAFMNGQGSSAASKMIGKFNGLLQAVGGLQAALIVMIAIKVVRWLNDAADAAEKFNAALANIATLLPGQQEKVRDYGDEIQRLSVEVGKTQEDLTDATYQVVSAFGDQANTMDTLAITAKASAAGLASTTDALNLLSAVSKGFNDTSTETLSKISDLAFTTVKLGQTTFPELASAIGAAVPMAEALGVSMEELFAIEATLTGVTGSAAEVTTQFRSILTALVKPTENLKALFEDVGVKSGQEFIEKAGGVHEALLLIKQSSEETGTELASYLGRVEGLTGALALTGAQMDNYRYKLEEMRRATGATQEAFEEQTEGINKYGFRLTQFSRKWEVLKVNLGQAILPLKSGLAEAFAPVVDLFASIFRYVSKIVQFFDTITRPIRLLSSAPLRLGVKALSLLMEGLGSVFDYLRNYAVALWNALRDRLAPVIDRVREFFKNLRSEVKGVADRFTDFIPKLPPVNAALLTLEGAIFAVGSAFDLVRAIVGTVIDSITTLINFASAAGNLLRNIFTGNFRNVKEDARAIVDVLKTGAFEIGDNWEEMSRSIGSRWDTLKTQAVELTSETANAGASVSRMADTVDALTESMEKNRRSWQSWLAEVTGIAENTFKTGAEAVALFVERQERLYAATIKTDAAFGTFTGDLGLLEQQAADVRNILIKLLSLSEDEVNEVFSGTDLSILALTERYKSLQQQIKVYKDIQETSIPVYEQVQTEFLRERINIGKTAEVYKKLGAEYDETTASSELYNQTLQKLIESTDVSADQILEFVEMFGYLKVVTEEAKTELDTVAGILENKLSFPVDKARDFAGVLIGIKNQLLDMAGEQYLSFFESFGTYLQQGITFGDSLVKSLGNIAQAILDALPELLFQIGVALIQSNQLWAGLGFIAASGIASVAKGAANEAVNQASATQNAHGNVFSTGKVIPFSRGGLVNTIVNSPTVFPMANGTGLMGESGPEAVMPLERLPNGDLGVQAVGSGTQVNIRVENYSDAEVSTETRDTPNGEEIVIMIKKVVKSGMNSGEFDGAMSQNFGLSRRGVS